MAKDGILEFKAFCKSVLTDEMINSLSKAMTGYCFRSGSIEDMHANGQLSQDDMLKIRNRLDVAKKRLENSKKRLIKTKMMLKKVLYSRRQDMSMNLPKQGPAFGD